MQDAEIDQVLCPYKLHNGRYAVCKDTCSTSICRMRLTKKYLKKLRGEGGGCASLTVELVRHFLTVFRCWTGRAFFCVGRELLYLSDVELSHSITEW
jgi:hypothetical protein